MYNWGCAFDTQRNQGFWVFAHFLEPSQTKYLPITRHTRCPRHSSPIQPHTFEIMYRRRISHSGSIPPGLVPFDTAYHRHITPLDLYYYRNGYTPHRLAIQSLTNGHSTAPLICQFTSSHNSSQPHPHPKGVSFREFSHKNIPISHTVHLRRDLIFGFHLPYPQGRLLTRHKGMPRSHSRQLLQLRRYSLWRGLSPVSLPLQEMVY